LKLNYLLHINQKLPHYCLNRIFFFGCAGLAISKFLHVIDCYLPKYDGRGDKASSTRVDTRHPL
ncbi:MAG: hypothetical protein ACXACU_18595, partial [Candidatus Hodarchaeales archaeon]